MEGLLAFPFSGPRARVVPGREDGPEGTEVTEAPQGVTPRPSGRLPFDPPSPPPRKPPHPARFPCLFVPSSDVSRRL